MAQQPVQLDPRNVYRINLAPHANQLLQFTFQPISDGPFVRLEISTGPPHYIRPAFPEHRGTSPVPLRDLLPDDIRNMFDSDAEGDDDVEVVDVQPARLSTTAQPADDLVVSETEPESDDEVAVISVQRVQPTPGPSRPSTVLPPEDLSLTEPETDEEETTTKQPIAGQRAGVTRIKRE